MNPTNSNPAPAPVPNVTKVRGGDLFLQLGAFGALYTCIGALLILLYRVIDAAFPPTSANYSYSFLFSSSTISFQVATLIVFFPVYLIISWNIQKIYAAEPARRDSRVRRGLIYLTLFFSGFFMAGDLVSVIYSFLNGDDITTGFLLKALSILVVFAGVFLYYIQDVRNKLTPQIRNLLRIFSIVLIIGSISWGFIVIGSPRTQKHQMQDARRISDLNSLQYDVTNYWQSKGMLPNAIGDLQNSLSYSPLPTDPDTHQSYEYVKTGATTFQLCATFSAEMPKNGVAAAYSVPSYYGDSTNSNWQYQKGHHCFNRTIDPQLYPVYNSAYNTPTAPPAVAPAKKY